jgi:hypothetical protein
MYGEDTGSLVIYTNTKANTMTEVYKISGEQGDQWKKLSVDIAITLQDKEWIQIVVEGVIGSSFQGTLKSKDFSLLFLYSFP